MGVNVLGQFPIAIEDVHSVHSLSGHRFSFIVEATLVFLRRSGCLPSFQVRYTSHGSLLLCFNWPDLSLPANPLLGEP